jgi:uncharacterized low-complexity protein
MISKTNLRPVAIGTAFVGSLALAGSAAAADNPFGLTALDGGYLQLAAAEGQSGSGSDELAKLCAQKIRDGFCGEGKCGEGKCGASLKEACAKKMEGKCGEGKCGGKK